MARIGNLLTAFLVLFPLLATAAEPKVVVVVQPNPVALDDSLQMRVEVIAEGGGEVLPPSFDAPEFTLVGKGSSSSYSTVLEGGTIQTRQRKLYTYVLAPKRAGVHKITNISVTVGGQQVSSHDIAVKVIPSSAGGGQSASDEEATNPAAPGQFQGSQDGSHPETLNSDFTVYLRLSKQQVYAGEPVVAEYFIYSPGGIQQIDIKKWPTFNGFWKEDLDIPSRYEWEPVYVNGRRMLRVLVGKFALYPIKPGKIKVDQLLITAKYVDRARAFEENDPFGLPQIFGNVRVGTHASKSETIEVMPLPDSGRPEGFSGAVGQFRVGLSSDKKQVPANSPVNFELSIEGTGNFHAIEAPKLGFPKDFELYESKANFQLGTPIGVARRLENRKVFTYLVLPRKEGSFTIPSLKFSWFDVGTKSYKTASTDSLSLEVTADQGGGGGANNNYIADAPAATEPKAKTLELRFLKPAGSLSDPVWQKYALLLLIAANLVIGALLLTKKISLRVWMDKLSRSPRRRLAVLLAEAKKSDEKEHYAAIERCLYGALDVLLGRTALGMTRDEIADAWRERGLPAPLLHKFQSLFDSADRERFAGDSTARLNPSVLKKNLNALRDAIEESIRLVK